MASVRSSRSARLSAQLEQAAVRQLLAEWHSINHGYFHNTLLAPTIELSSNDSLLGRWNRQYRTIELSRRFVFEQPWPVVLEVLKHEVAHQYTHEVLRAVDESAHGAAFRSVCERCGIDPAAKGVPSNPSEPDSEEDKVLQRIARLLALADSPNEHEAQAAMNAAQKLMLRYNLDHVERLEARRYGFRHLGRASGRITEAERVLANILSTHFFVEAIWVPVYLPDKAKTASVLEICGTHANLEMASYVHSFLLETAERLWLEHKKKQGIRANRDRRAFVAGVMFGFRDKLQVQESENQTQGLVWVRDANLDDYLRKRFPNIRHRSYRASPPNMAYVHGRAAGQSIVLHRPVGAGPSQGPTKLLGR